MGKKLKTGKQRKDKYYHLAKEAGYRSRAAFKLIQLNRRFEFLQRSRALVDLCAAPGGWLQVASQNMPVSSLCIGIDLVPIKPLKNCITLQGDITTEKARQMIKKELQTWDADCVLHDGAPNVGLNWIHDAFQQNCLVLSALKLATLILAKNGTFVTKVFRSNDYQSLIDVFEKLFKKVHVWKPAASRLESAEIFVVCEKYLKPAKIKPEWVDARKVFSETEIENKVSNPHLLLQARKNQKKVKAEGYEEGTLSVFKAIPASDFIHTANYLEILGTANKIVLDDKRWEESEATTEELRHCIADIKVCGPRELRLILAWRKKMLKLVETEADFSDTAAEIEKDPKNIEDEKMAEIEQKIKAARAQDKAVLKKKKKKLLKEKARAAKRKQLGMDHGDDIGTLSTEQDLFSLSKLKRTKSSQVGENDKKVESTLKDDILETDSLSLNEENEIENGLLHTDDPVLSKEDKRTMRASKWFSREGIVDFLDDEDEALAAIENHLKRKKAIISSEENDDQSVSNDSSKLLDVEERSKHAKVFEESTEECFEQDKDSCRLGDKANLTNAKKRRLDPELLALGEQLIYSSKTRRDLEDWSWNRYTNNDEGLPEWFVDDERKHYRKALPVTKEQVQKYKERLKELNARPIKKIADAQARRKKRELMRLQRAKKRAEGIIDNENMDQREKLKEMKKIYRNAAKKEKRDVTYQVMTKGKRGRLIRPGGLYKVVDARQKKDNRKEKMKRRKKTWQKMNSSAKRAEMEKARKRRATKRKEKMVNRRLNRGKPV